MNSTQFERNSLSNVCKEGQPLRLGIAVVDPSGQALYLNDEARQLLAGRAEVLPELLRGIEQGRANGNGLAELIGEEHHEKVSLRALAVEQAENPASKATVLLIEPMAKIVSPPLGSSSPYRLTRREQEVISYLAKGYSNKEIAQALSIGLYTVKDHLKSIMKKMEVKNRLGVLLKSLEIYSPEAPLQEAA